MIKGKNPTLLNVTYVRPPKKEDPDRDYKRECFQVVYLDDDGIPRYSKEKPLADIWIVKPEYRNYLYNKPQERIDHMYKLSVPVSKIRDVIKRESGEWGRTIYNRACDSGSYNETMNQLFTWPFCYGCDFQPEYYFLKKWYDKYELKSPKLTKAFMDIEIDLIDYQVDLDNIPLTAKAPVNLVSLIFESSNECFLFVLRPYEPQKGGRTAEEYAERYRLYEDQLKQHKDAMAHLDDFIDKIHQEFDPVYGYMDYKVLEFEKEIDLIVALFRTINERKPNFLGTWNMRFDIQYLYWRTITLGYDPSSIMCHPDFKNGRCNFQLDKSTYLVEKQYDYFYCDSYTQYICLMRLYASIRKSQHKLRSVKLNAIGERELRDRKVEYPEQANIVSFAYLAWQDFWKYNIKDSALIKGIERKTNDMLTYYMRSHSNLTPYNKIFKETHLLRNVREMYFEKDGWVQGNNINIIKMRKKEMNSNFYGNNNSSKSNDDEKVSFKGAINAEPSMNDYIGEKILGVPSNNIFYNSMDYDMGAFYPSIKISSNMDPGTLIFKAAFFNEEFISGQFPNRSQNQKYEEIDKNRKVRKLDLTGEAVNTYTSDNILTFGYNWMNMPSITELEKYLIKRM